MIPLHDKQHWCDICGPKRGFGDHQSDRHEDYAFKNGRLTLPNGDVLKETYASPNHFALYGPKGGIRHAHVQLWVHGARARDVEQFLSFLNGDAHDQSKCQLFAQKLRGGKFWSVS